MVGLPESMEQVNQLCHFVHDINGNYEDDSDVVPVETARTNTLSLPPVIALS